jgi:hypothetical protein
MFLDEKLRVTDIMTATNLCMIHRVSLICISGRGLLSKLVQFQMMFATSSATSFCDVIASQ